MDPRGWARDLTPGSSAIRRLTKNGLWELSGAGEHRPPGNVTSRVGNNVGVGNAADCCVHLAPMARVAQSRAQRDRRGRADCWTLHSGANAASFAVDDGHSQHLSGLPLVGAICGANSQ